MAARVLGYIRGVGSTIDRVNEIATSIAAAMEEPSAATQEIARNVQQAATGTAEVSSSITTVNSSASQAGIAENEVLKAAQSLSDQSQLLATEVDSFSQEVRVA